MCINKEMHTINHLSGLCDFKSLVKTKTTQVNVNRTPIDIATMPAKPR